MANLPLYFEQRRVGAIDVDKSGPGFLYDADWIALPGAFPISITMPLNVERISPDIFLPWAANLLPESEQLRTIGQLLGDNGAQRRHRSVVRNRRRHGGCALDWTAGENCIGPLAADRTAGAA